MSDGFLTTGKSAEGGRGASVPCPWLPCGLRSVRGYRRGALLLFGAGLAGRWPRPRRRPQLASRSRQEASAPWVRAARVEVADRSRVGRATGWSCCPKAGGALDRAAAAAIVSPPSTLQVSDFVDGFWQPLPESIRRRRRSSPDLFVFLSAGDLNASAERRIPHRESKPFSSERRVRPQARAPRVIVLASAKRVATSRSRAGPVEAGRALRGHPSGLGLDRPEHGGKLGWSGRERARLSTFKPVGFGGFYAAANTSAFGGSTTRSATLIAQI
jgi:hypothetical protein